MNSPGGSRVRALFGLLLLFCCSGCLGLGGERQPTRYFTLSSMAGEQKGNQLSGGPPGLIVGVGPLILPAYLDRPQLVTRKNPHEYRIAEFSRWGEPLEKSFLRALAGNLSALLETDRILLFPWRGTVDLQVTADVLRFDCNERRQVRLEVNWMVLGGKPRRPLLVRHFEIETEAAQAADEEVVVAMSRALALFSDEVGRALTTLAVGEPGEPARGAQEESPQ